MILNGRYVLPIQYASTHIFDFLRNFLPFGIVVVLFHLFVIA